MWGDIAIAFLLAFITAFMMTPYSIRLAKKVGAVDVPKDNRRMHHKPMPKLGGVAVIAGFIVSFCYLTITMLIEDANRINLFGPEQYGYKLIGYFELRDDFISLIVLFTNSKYSSLYLLYISVIASLSFALENSTILVGLCSNIDLIRKTLKL